MNLNLYVHENFTNFKIAVVTWTKLKFPIMKPVSWGICCFAALTCQELCSTFCSGTNCTVAKELLRVSNKFQEMFLSGCKHVFI